jgi:transposase
VPTLDHTLKPEATTVRRLEVITGTGRRRRFSEDEKARVVEETLVPGAVASEVARRHGLTPQQVFTWRRQARQPTSTSADAEAQQFVPAVVDAPPESSRKRGKTRIRRLGDAFGVIEVEIEGVVVRVGRGADAKTVAAVIRALKAGT